MPLIGAAAKSGAALPHHGIASDEASSPEIRRSAVPLAFERNADAAAASCLHVDRRGVTLDVPWAVDLHCFVSDYGLHP